MKEYVVSRTEKSKVANKKTRMCEKGYKDGIWSSQTDMKYSEIQCMTLGYEMVKKNNMCMYYNA